MSPLSVAAGKQLAVPVISDRRRAASLRASERWRKKPNPRCWLVDGWSIASIMKIAAPIESGSPVLPSIIRRISAALSMPPEAVLVSSYSRVVARNASMSATG